MNGYRREDWLAPRGDAPEPCPLMVNAPLNMLGAMLTRRRPLLFILRLPVDVGRRLGTDIAVAHVMADGLGRALRRRAEAGAAAALESNHVTGLEMPGLDRAQLLAIGPVRVEDYPRRPGAASAAVT